MCGRNVCAACCIGICLLAAVCASAAPERVVALEGSLAEIWTLAGGTLAGVTSDAEERGIPAQGAAIVGSVKSPNLEAILAREPDLVLLSADIASQAPLKETLTALAIPFREERVDRFGDYYALLEAYCAMTGRADLLVRNGDDVAERVRAVLDSVPSGAQKDALLLRAYASGVKVKGADNLAGEMLTEMGCVLLADDAKLGELSLEAIVRADPEYVFITCMGDERAAESWLENNLFANPAWRALTAVRAGRVVMLPKALFHYKPNARWDESYQFLREALYG